MQLRSRALRAVLVAVLTTTPIVLTGGPAHAAERVTIEGNGFGHGRGLSQHGAQSAALHGLGYRQIVNFYYPGLSWSKAAKLVAVLITADTSSDVVVKARRGLKATSLNNGRQVRLAKNKRAKLWRITPAAGGRKSAVAFRAKGSKRWRTVRTLPGDAQFSAGGKPIRLHTPAGVVAYRGVLRSASPSAGGSTTRDTVNVVGLDGYLKGVVPREVPALWDPDAVKAQSVAARTYAAFERRQAPRGRHYQICDTAQCQVYGGKSAEHRASNAAIRATKRQILTQGGKPAFTQFSASNGGFSDAGSFGYLPAQRDPYDTAYRGWRVTVPAATFERAFPSIGTFETLKVVRRDGNGAFGGRVEDVRVVGSRTSTTIPGDRLRVILGLRSTMFRVR